jgi:hypothetical protein
MCEFRVSARSVKNVVTVFSRRVAGEALCVQRFVARFAVREVGETPAAGCGVFLRILYHELNVHRGPGKGGVEAGAGKTGSQGFLVGVRGVFVPVQGRNFGAIRKRQSPVAESLDGKVVAQFGAQLPELASSICQLLARQSLDGDQMPVPISLRKFDPLDRRSLAV